MPREQDGQGQSREPFGRLEREVGGVGQQWMHERGRQTGTEPVVNQATRSVQPRGGVLED